MLWLPRLGGLRPKDEDRQEVRLPWPTRGEQQAQALKNRNHLLPDGNSLQDTQTRDRAGPTQHGPGRAGVRHRAWDSRPGPPVSGPRTPFPGTHEWPAFCPRLSVQPFHLDGPRQSQCVGSPRPYRGGGTGLRTWFQRGRLPVPGAMNPEGQPWTAPCDHTEEREVTPTWRWEGS